MIVMTRKLQSLLAKKGPIKKIGVVGMGYVGIPAAVLFADAIEFDLVLGFQRASSTSGYKIDMLNRGESPLKGNEPGLEELLKNVIKAEKFKCTSDFSTDGMARHILEDESGLIAGEDFALAHAPERVMVGRLLKNIREHDRIVGGIDDVSTQRVAELYAPVLTIGKIIKMTATAAEVTKTAENTFRDLQIAAVNQLALYCEAMGINVYDVRAGIDSLKGDGITRAVLWPGAGVGGHCLTKDTYHLERGVKILGDDLDYPDGADSIYVLARKVNDFMPTHMYHLTVDALERVGKRPEGSKIAILGWAFINDSDDARNPPSESYRDLLLEAGAKVAVHDPHVLSYPGVELEKNLDEVVKEADVVSVMTAHSDYFNLDPDWMKELTGQENPVIVDGRNVVEPDKFINLGFVYKGIGRGDKNGHEIRTFA
jgi:UDP-N-acetyl-D-mannosaminuronic acid dehydrogenase